MFTYTFTKLDKMGEPHETYGQAYWGSVNEELRPVKFNSSNENITADDTIECEEQAERKSTKGTVYLQLKKVKVIDVVKTSDPRVITTEPSSLSYAPDSTTQAQLDRIEEKLDTLIGAQTEAKEDLSGVPDFLRPDGEQDE